ncbi:MAG: hypothetical protein C4320_01410 [Armatimonadota bacterium]
MAEFLYVGRIPTLRRFSSRVPAMIDEAVTQIPPDIPRGDSSLPTSRRTYFLEASVGRRCHEMDPQELLREAANLVTTWFDDKIPGHLSEAIYKLESDVMDQEGLNTVRTIGALEKGYWGGWVRYLDRERQGGRERAVAGRIWRAEIVLRIDEKAEPEDGRVRVSVQMFMGTCAGADQTLQYDRPSIIDKLEEKLGLKDLYAITPTVPNISAERLMKFVNEDKRKRSVVVLTESSGSPTSFDYVVDREKLGRQLLGIAWVVALNNKECKKWSNLVGRRWTAYNGTLVRYRPALDWESDEPRDHPRISADYITRWTYRAQQGEGAFRSYLTEQCVQDAADPMHQPGEGMQFADIEAEDLAARREAASYGELLPLAEEEIGNLKAQIGELRSTYEATAFDLELAKEDAAFDQQNIQNLLAQIEHLQVLNREQGIVPEERPRPTSYGDIAEWCEREFTSRLVLHNRAKRALKKASYEDVNLVLDALHTLAFEGRAWLGSEERGKRVFDEKCESLGLTCSQSMAESRSGEEYEAYHVEYPPGSGRKVFMEWHLKRGVSHEAKHCLRIYFFWDDTRKVVVVGYLPDHLPTRNG